MRREDQTSRRTRFDELDVVSQKFGHIMGGTVVIPAKAGIQKSPNSLDSRFHGNDGLGPKDS